ncbi:uncharacterized protein O3C94_012505 [Discoglossus pictus]
MTMFVPPTPLMPLILPLLYLLLPGLSAHGRPRSEQAQEVLLCRVCGFEVAGSEDLHFMPSPHSLSRENSSVTIGEQRVRVQLLGEPTGEQHYVISLRRAAINMERPARRSGTWYPGYSWMGAACPRCHTRLGWAYQPDSWRLFSSDVEFEDSEETFVALMIDQLMQETFSPSMIEMPKETSTS